MEKTLIIFRGAPGSGKTTVAELLSHSIGITANDSPVHSADHYFEDEDGNYNWDPSKLSEAHAQCKLRTEDAMINESLFVFVANTFTQQKEITPYQKLAEKYGYRFVSLIVENRHGNKSVHNVPDNAMDRMKDRFEVNL